MVKSEHVTRFTNVGNKHISSKKPTISFEKIDVVSEYTGLKGDIVKKYVNGKLKEQKFVSEKMLAKLFNRQTKKIRHKIEKNMKSMMKYVNGGKGGAQMGGAQMIGAQMGGAQMIGANKNKVLVQDNSTTDKLNMKLEKDNTIKKLQQKLEFQQKELILAQQLQNNRNNQPIPNQQIEIVEKEPIKNGMKVGFGFGLGVGVAEMAIEGVADAIFS